ncbi:MAG: hypothetical protein Kow00103_11070 [Candidatus Caldatribacteriota bacterium]
MERIIRIKYTKEGMMKYLSHLNLVQIFSRAIRRAELPVSISNGFNPRFRISFGPPLPLGINSQAEYLDIKVIESVNLKELQKKLNHALPEGIKVIKGKEIPPPSSSLSKAIDSALFIVFLNLKRKKNNQQAIVESNQILTLTSKEQKDEAIKENLIEREGNCSLIEINQEIRNFLQQKEMIIEKSKPDGVKKINIRPFISIMQGLNYKKGVLELKLHLKIGPQGNINPYSLVEYWLNQSPYQGEIIQIYRQELYEQGRAVM